MNLDIQESCITKDTMIKVIENGNVVKKVQKTRQRRIHSCMHCHSKKIKCSRNIPCENCIKLKIECKYFINERQSRGGKKSSRLTEDEKVSRGIVHRQQESSNDDSDSSVNMASSATTSLEEEEMTGTKDFKHFENPLKSESRSNDVPLSSIMQSPIVNNFANNITNTYFNGNFTTKNPQTNSWGINSPTTMHLPPNEDSISFGLSSFPLANQDMILNNFLQGQNANSEKGAFNSSSNNIYLFNATATSENNDNLLGELSKYLPPNKERSLELVERYIKSVHLLLPIIPNMSEFLIEHEVFLNLAEFPDPNFNYLQFFTLYFPILYAATISEFEEFDNLLLNQDIDKYLRATYQINRFYNYPYGKPSMSILLANVLIESLSPNPSTIIMSQIIRYAKFLQLHKDPLLTLRIQDSKIANFRRLLWWVIFGLDALSSHNFCLPPNCRIDDYNVLLPDEMEIVDNVEKLNLSILSLNNKFRYDKVLSELVYHLHNGLNLNISNDSVAEIKAMILTYYYSVRESIDKMNQYYKINMPTSVQEMNLISFVTNHCWCFVDRVLMLLHKRILLNDGHQQMSQTLYFDTNNEDQGGNLSLSKYEDTFARIQEANIIENFKKSSISLLRFNQHENFTYENLSNNLIPSILHNLNDFLKYNDFIKFGKYNWYIKRTIPLDSVIIMFIIITVKFKYQFINSQELSIYVNLINRTLFIINRKYFKNEKYKRMLSLTNLTWEYILKTFHVRTLLCQSQSDESYFDYQITSSVNMTELFTSLDVPQPVEFITHIKINHDAQFPLNSIETSIDLKTELNQLKSKIQYDLRNNFVDVNDYCAFYSSLENILNELMSYINE